MKVLRLANSRQSEEQVATPSRDFAAYTTEILRGLVSSRLFSVYSKFIKIGCFQKVAFSRDFK
jgi:hypothetical protein